MAKPRQKVLFVVRPKSPYSGSSERAASAPSGSEPASSDGSTRVRRRLNSGQGIDATNTPPGHQIINPFLSPSMRGDNKKGVSFVFGEREEKEKGEGHLASEPDSDRLGNLLAGIDRLQKSERKELLARLALAENGPAAPSRDLDMWSLAVHSALVDAIGAGDGVGLGPLPVKRLLGASNSWTPVLDFMERIRLSELEVVRRQAVYRMLAGLLVEHAKGVARFAGIPLSPKFVANCARQLPAIVDAAYPGYARAGLMPLVAQRLTRKRKEGDGE